MVFDESIDTFISSETLAELAKEAMVLEHKLLAQVTDGVARIAKSRRHGGRRRNIGRGC